MSNNTESRIKTIIAKHFDVDENTFTSDTKLIEDLGADSLDQIELLMSIEDEYGLGVTDHALVDQLITVGQIIDYIPSSLVKRIKELEEENTQLKNNLDGVWPPAKNYQNDMLDFAKRKVDWLCDQLAAMDMSADDWLERANEHVGMAKEEDVYD